MSHKKVYYSLNLRYFKDSDGSGVGDLIGLVSQVSYFKFLGVDAIILQDVFSYNLKTRPFMEIDPQLGTTVQLQWAIKKFHEHDLKLLIELPFDSLKHNYLWLKNAENIANDFSTREIYLHEALTSELSINSDQTLLTNLLEIVSIWQSWKIDGFVIKNFEYLGNITSRACLSSRTIKLLKELYVRVKTLNKDFQWIGLTENLTYGQIKHFTLPPHKLFDEIMSFEIANHDIHRGNKENYNGVFRVKKLIKYLKQIQDNKKAVLIFGSTTNGRVTSRWANDLGYWKEASKCLAIIFYLNKNNNNLLFADELGLSNYHFKFNEHLQDQKTIAQKRHLQSQGLKINKIINKQKLHHYKNNMQAMPWNETLNGGFSSNKKCQALINKHYKENNVTNQFHDQSSILDFNRKLIAFVKSNFFMKIITFGNFKIKTKHNGIVVIKGKNDFDKFFAYVNLSTYTKKIWWFNHFKKHRINLSTYQNQQDKLLTSKLKAYEGIIVLKTSKEYAEDQAMFWTKKTKKQKKQDYINDQQALDNVKMQSKLEREVVKKMKKDLEQMDENEQALIEQQRTTLTDEEIAKTVQVDIDGVDDLEDFIQKNLSPPKDN